MLRSIESGEGGVGREENGVGERITDIRDA